GAAGATHCADGEGGCRVWRNPVQRSVERVATQLHCRVDRRTAAAGRALVLISPAPGAYQAVSLPVTGADCVPSWAVALMVVTCFRALANVPAGTSTVSIAALLMVCVRSSVIGLLFESWPKGRFCPTTWETWPSATGNSACTEGT